MKFSRLAGLAGALALCAHAYASGLRPPPVRTVSQWAAERRVVAAESGSPWPGRWSNARVPYLVAPMDAASFAHPCREVTIKGAAQVAKSEIGLNAIGQAIDETPAPILLVLPTLDEAKKYVKIKLQPTIDETPALKSKVKEQKSRDEDGSTTSFKKFRNGFLQVTGANSSKGLQMVSARLIVREEIAEWPLDVDNRGDPMDLSAERANFWRGREKIVNISAPGLKGTCRISARYEASDQSRFHVACPSCGARQTLEWSQLQFTAATPEEAASDDVFYVCAANGCVIGHADKARMIAEGEWVARFPDRSSLHRGFALNALYSPTLSWADLVARWLAARGQPQKEKVFTQQVLGEAYEEKGDAPEAVKLLARREAFHVGALPPGVLVVTGAIDVQANRLEYAVWGWGLGFSSWLVDKGVVDGDPTVPATWRAMDEIVARTYPDALGNHWPVDRWAVDSGFQTQSVYQWARGKPRVIAVKGMDGHLRPAIGTPTPQEVTIAGKKWKRGIKLHPVGTWTVKAEFYANLRKVIDGPDADGNFAPGYIHFPAEVDEAYLEQLTAESLQRTEHRGRVRQAWVKRPGIPNEALDLRVYARAALAHMGADAWSRRAWADLTARRAVRPETVQGDFERVWGAAAVASPRPATASPAVADDAVARVVADKDAAAVRSPADDAARLLGEA